MSTLKALVPWVKRPLVTVPPMAFVSRSDLTIAAATAGVLGFLACGYELDAFQTDLSLVLSALRSLELDLPNLPDGLSPFGVGFVVWTTPIDVLDRVFPGDGVTPHPAAIWLFAGDFEEWIPIVRKKSPDTVIFVQVGGLQEARRAMNAGADALVAQGIDAGGHGNADSASIISLVPELASEFPGVPIIAAGGIADASGILASLALGADGVVVGTRIATCTESAMAEKAKDIILQTSDGGASTKRTRIYDVLRGKGDWIASQNGRAIINDTLREYESGASVKDLQEKHDIARRENDYNRLVVYAGTGLGLVKQKQSLSEILDELEAQFAEKVKALNEKLRSL